jgi:hypothetical protein
MYGQRVTGRRWVIASIYLLEVQLNYMDTHGDTSACTLVHAYVVINYELRHGFLLGGQCPLREYGSP